MTVVMEALSEAIRWFILMGKEERSKQRSEKKVFKSMTEGKWKCKDGKRG